MLSQRCAVTLPAVDRFDTCIILLDGTVTKQVYESNRTVVVDYNLKGRQQGHTSKLTRKCHSMVNSPLDFHKARVLQKTSL